MGHNQKLKQDQKRQLFIGIALLVLVAVGWSLVQDWYQSRSRVDAVFRSPAGDMRGTFQLEVADEPAEQSKGLMFRKALAPRTGMIFVNKTDEVQSFWMKNTFVSLDMIFVDGNKQVVGILSDVPILNEEPRKIDRPSRYVVELAAGEAARAGIVVGDVLSF